MAWSGYHSPAPASASLSAWLGPLRYASGAWLEHLKFTAPDGPRACLPGSGANSPDFGRLAMRLAHLPPLSPWLWPYE